MKIVVGFPPNIDAIEQTFPDIRKMPVVFCYGDTIYNPDATKSVPLHLQAHEEVHMQQQELYDGGPEAWWREYLDNPQFRIEQEIPAYARQVAYIHESTGGRKTELALQTYSRALSGPIYGHAISYFSAKQRIKKAMQAPEE